MIVSYFGKTTVDKNKMQDLPAIMGGYFFILDRLR